MQPRNKRCYRVPDGAADSFLAASLNVASAREYGADAWTYCQVERLEVDSGRVVGAVCRDLVRDEPVRVNAALVVNAAGAWSGAIAATAQLVVPVVCGKGTMVAMHYRSLKSVVNRCRPAADGDIVVPTHTVAVVGTTDEKVADPDRFPVEAWEIEAMLTEGEKILPGLRQGRMVRVWAGVRPLYHESDVAAGADRQVSRSHYLLDHAERDGMEGLVTIIGGKWTTYRLMAEQTVDQVCQKLGSQAACRTASEALATGGHAGYHRRWAPLAAVESSKAYGQLVCECELATQSMVEASIVKEEARTIDDIRRDVRLGMGTCQGGFCTYRAAGLWHRLRQPEVTGSNVALRDFLQERWKGLLPVLDRQQIRQSRLNELIYRDVLNAEGLPGPAESRLGSVLYEAAGAGVKNEG